MVDASKKCPEGMKLISGGPFKSEVAPFCIDEHEYTQEENAAYESSRPDASFELIVKSRSGGATSIVARGNAEDALKQKAIAFLQKDKDVSGVEIKNATVSDRPKIEGKLAGPRKPMVYINRNEARARCRARGADLPNGDQWEKAARGPNGKEYGTKSGELKKEEARFDTHDGPADVMSYPPNDYGVYDMTGNVSEWVLDGVFFQDIRGGSWDDFFALYQRATTRLFYGLPGLSGSDVGFRCVSAPRTSQR